MGGSTFRSTYTINCTNTNTRANSQYVSPSYRIGQNRIITSSFQPPRLAEVKQLSSYNPYEGTTCCEEESPFTTMRRVGGNDHLPDPYLNTPIGDTPWLLMMVLCAAWVAIRWFRKMKAQKKA